MTLTEAKQIIKSNYEVNGNSLCYYLHEECEFSVIAFWEYCDAISLVVRNSVKEEILTAQITIGYYTFLKELICHFSPTDIAVMEHLPDNYTDYIERLDFAVRAYLENMPEWVEDAMFDLNKSTVV